ncbi:multiple epidermal growth factor-like domains protein 10 [Saccostrea cucullata]|uniref:multiple epidermal growth factor-like domains protein 10 n=1 Tax=Saccostrea cuccullata TaxID=36930 RepID=UPI002ECFEA2C
MCILIDTYMLYGYFINMFNLIDLFCVIFPLISTGCSGLDNIALHKTFHVESVYPGFEGKEYRAVDGNRSQKKKHCIFTNPENKKPTYVYVDIGYIANIYNVTIYYRKKYEQRLHGYALYYSDKLFRKVRSELDLEGWNLCYKDDSISDKPNGVESQICKGTARYVLIYQNKSWNPKKSPILGICEIEIFGCNPRQFSKVKECIPCPGKFCEVCGTDGVCLECTNHRYGNQCEKSCSKSCVGGCNISTGQCYSCNPGQFSKGKECIPCPAKFCAYCGTDGICLECENHRYGYQCEKSCSDSCVGGCNFSTGQCYSCNRGQFSKGKECIPCPAKFCAYCGTDGICLECESHRYGYQCEKSCSESCVRGCNIGTGQCYTCSPDKFGIFCNETCGQCREEPNKESCDDVTGTCVSGCERGFSGRLCDEECNGTSFGYNCNETCCKTCKWTANGIRLCNSSSGHCYSCVAGKRGVYCNEDCMSMTYGENCLHICGHCFNGSGCNSVSGACAEGCDAGYQGINCNETCENKTFGSKCGEICGHCRNDTACDPFSGSCDSGCEPGYQGLTCKETCGFCRQNTDCDQFNGTCLGGCQEGYQGEICNEICDINYYGEDCNFTCNEHCACAVPTSVSICHHVTGECLMGCKDGWIGKRSDSGL